MVSLSGQQGIIQHGSSKSKLTVITWNIFRGTRIDDVLAYFRKQDPDVIALQEVSETIYQGIPVNAATVLARELDMNVHYCRAMVNERHDPPYELGNAILSRYPLTLTSCLPASLPSAYDGTPASENRVICEAYIQFQGMAVRVLSTHLYHPHQPATDEIARTQFDTVVSVLDDSPTILMGDFNAELDSPLVQKISNVIPPGGITSKMPTFRNIKYNPDETRIFDHVFASKQFKILKYEVSDEKGSDHLPVRCEIELEVVG